MRAQRSGVRTAVVAAVGVAVLAVVADLAAHQPAPPLRTTTDHLVGGAPALPDLPPATGEAYPWWLVIIAVGGLALIGAMVWFLFREGVGMEATGRRAQDVRPGEQDRSGLREQFTATADRALADAAAGLAAGGDAREVVIACWVRLELAAEHLGEGRRPAETATDVARRWLAGSADRAAVDDLAALFHLARYSTHPMTDADRDRAVTALRGVLRVSA